MTSNNLVTEYGLDALAAILHETAMADVIIRLLDIYAAMRNSGDLVHSLDEVLEKKININKERPVLHGNLF